MARKLTKTCPNCHTNHPENYKRCAMCRSVLQPLNVAKDKKYDSTHVDPFGGLGTSTTTP